MASPTKQVKTHIATQAIKPTIGKQSSGKSNSNARQRINLSSDNTLQVIDTPSEAIDAIRDNLQQEVAPKALALVKLAMDRLEIKMQADTLTPQQLINVTSMLTDKLFTITQLQSSANSASLADIDITLMSLKAKFAPKVSTTDTTNNVIIEAEPINND